MTGDIDDVMERAVEILSDEGMEVTQEELKDLYDNMTLNIKEALRSKPYLSTMIPNLGTAYYKLSTVNRRINSYPKNTDSPTKRIWQKRRTRIKEEFNMNQPLINASRHYVLYHIVDGIMTYNLRKHKISDIETRQNQ